MNWSEFFSMGGYAFYVWGSYLVALIAMGGEVLLLWQRNKSLRKGQNRERVATGCDGKLLTGE